ncbi:MAG: hypothetical protein WD894_20090 [Pirellulales bacterium]
MRRRFRFSLAVLLVVVTAIAILFNTIRRKADKARTIDRLVRELEDTGGDVERVGSPSSLMTLLYPSVDFRIVDEVRCGRRTTSAEICDLLPLLDDVTVLDLAGVPLTDECLRPIGRLCQLIHLDLSHTLISDEGLSCVRPLNRLGALIIQGCEVTDACLDHVRSSELRELWIDETDITDEGLAILARLKSLRVLRARQTKISAKGLVRLLKSVPLEILDVSATNLDDASMSAFRHSESLQELSLRETQIETLASLPSMSSLRSIDLSLTDVNDEAVQRLGVAAPKIEELGLDGTAVSEKTLWQVAKWKSLIVISVRKCKLEASSIDEFRRLRPNVAVWH